MTVSIAPPANPAEIASVPAARSAVTERELAAHTERSGVTEREATPRAYLMCPPTYFEVRYAINAWMDTAVPVDTAKALTQWENLRQLYLDLGHTVHVLDPVLSLPDMVFSANGAFSVDGVIYGALFKHSERTAEAEAHRAWYSANGWGEVVIPHHVNEGEGDFTFVAGPGLVLAGYGFRTDPLAHAEAQDVLGRPVVGLHLIDPRFYHLDTALFVVDDTTICYYPQAFSAGSQRVLRRLFPDAVLASEEDALAFGLNAVSDGHHVVLPTAATGLAATLAARGYTPLPIDLSELLKGGGSVKCCTAELRP